MGSSASVISDEDKLKIRDIIKDEFHKCYEEHLNIEDTNERIFQTFKSQVIASHPDIELNEKEIIIALRKEYVTEDHDQKKNRKKSLNEILHHGPSIPVRQTHGSHNHKPIEKPNGIFDDPFKHPLRKLKKLTGRRRSFDQEQAVGQAIPTSITSCASFSQDSINVEANSHEEQGNDIIHSIQPESHPEIDHWDSVTHQPFCKFCHMTFKSIEMLQRHEKYSELHSINAGKGKSEKIKKDTPAIPYVDGVDYKLLYHGSKFFWKSHNSFEIHFFQHSPFSTIEIVVNDVETKFELSRIYLDYTIIQSAVEENVERTCSAKVHDKLGHDKFAHDNEHEHEALRVQILNKAVVEYILKRLSEAEHEIMASAPSADAPVEPIQEESDQQEPLPESKIDDNENKKTNHPKCERRDSAFGPQSLHVHHKDELSYLNPAPQSGPTKPRYIDYLHPVPRYELKHGNYTHIDYKTASNSKDKEIGDNKDHIDAEHPLVTHELLEEEERKILQEIFDKKPKTKGVIFVPSLVDTTSALLESCPENLQPVPIEIHVPIVALTKSVDEVIRSVDEAIHGDPTK